MIIACGVIVIKCTTFLAKSSPSLLKVIPIYVVRMIGSLDIRICSKSCSRYTHSPSLVQRGQARVRGEKREQLVHAFGRVCDHARALAASPEIERMKLPRASDLVCRATIHTLTSKRGLRKRLW